MVRMDCSGYSHLRALLPQGHSLQGLSLWPLRRHRRVRLPSLAKNDEEIKRTYYFGIIHFEF